MPFSNDRMMSLAKFLPASPEFPAFAIPAAETAPSEWAEAAKPCVSLAESLLANKNFTKNCPKGLHCTSCCLLKRYLRDLSRMDIVSDMSSTDQFPFHRMALKCTEKNDKPPWLAACTQHGSQAFHTMFKQLEMKLLHKCDLNPRHFLLKN